MVFFKRSAAVLEASSPEHRYQKLKTELHLELVERVDASKLGQWKEERLKNELRLLAGEMLEERRETLNGAERERLLADLHAEMFGLGPLEPLMSDPSVCDILVNGPNQVYVERGGRLELTDLVFADQKHLLQIIQRISARVGRRIDEMSPMVDARLPDGSRVHAVIPPLALNGAVLSIRRFGVRLDSDELLRNGTVAPAMLQLLRAAVQARISLLVSGGTGSGKTTLLNVLSRFIPAEERLITVEDAAELKLQQPHVIRLETRPANSEGAGEVRQRELVRNALRMRPDRIIVGEVRGGEALDMLQAMNTGHEGSLTTIHANDTRDALTRLETMVMMAGFELPVPVIRQYIASALTLVVQLARLKGGQRKIVRVSEIVGLKNNRYVMRDLFGFERSGVRDGCTVGHFYGTGRRPRFLERLRASGVDVPEGLFDRRMLAGAIAEEEEACVP
jgi:pilus assembly protein CpaF